MDWNRLEGNWKQLSGRAKQQWGKLTDDDIKASAGRRDALVGKVQERYGMSRDDAQKQVDDWARRADDSWIKHQ
jgi:uncharacterized protein YjbJ (UPF0337 family)